MEAAAKAGAGEEVAEKAAGEEGAECFVDVVEVFSPLTPGECAGEGAGEVREAAGLVDERDDWWRDSCSEGA